MATTGNFITYTAPTYTTATVTYTTSTTSNTTFTLNRPIRIKLHISPAAPYIPLIKQEKIEVEDG